jgi:UDP-N-acetylglucosamine 2-epimerase (non-hydrolysing)
VTGELLVVVGARPNFVKVAPVVRALQELGVPLRLAHTGQHYDWALSGAFLEQLGMPEPDHALAVGSGTHAEQTAAVMVGVERVLVERPATAVLVAGDVNSTMAAALAAAKLGAGVIHLEAGLRSGDWSMPEEVNRVVTDRVADLLLCPSADAVEHLRAEGVPAERIELVGNTMIDSLFALLEAARATGARERLGLAAGAYVLVTLHRPALVDDPQRLGAVLDVLGELAQRLPVLAPLHPRTRARLGARELPAGVTALDPLPYLEFVALEADARLVVTDSGGVQEETSALGVDCVTYRTTTERPITVTAGTNRLVGVDPAALRRACTEILDGEPPREAPSIPLWDGRAASRAARTIATFAARRSLTPQWQ